MPARLYPDLEAFYKKTTTDNYSWAAGPDADGNTGRRTHFYANAPSYTGQADVADSSSHIVGIHLIEPSAPPFDFNQNQSFKKFSHFHRNILSNDSDHLTVSDNNETSQRINAKQRRATVANAIKLNNLNDSKLNIRSSLDTYRPRVIQTPFPGDIVTPPSRYRQVAFDTGRRRGDDYVTDVKRLNVSSKRMETSLQQRHQQALHYKLCCIRTKPSLPTDQRPSNQRPANQRHSNQRPTNQWLTSKRPSSQGHTNQRPTIQRPTSQGPSNPQPTNPRCTNHRVINQNSQSHDLMGDPHFNPRTRNSPKSLTAPGFDSSLESENIVPIIQPLNCEAAKRQDQGHVKFYSKPSDYTQKPWEEEFQGWLSWRQAVNGHFSKSILTHPDPVELSRDREHVTKKQPHPGAMVRVFQEAAGDRTTCLEQKTYILFGIPRVTRLHLMDIANKTQPYQCQTVRT